MARHDGLADWYDTEFLGTLHEQTLRRAVQLVGAGAGRLLDLGCGTGAQTVAFRDAGWQVIGVDVSADMLRRAAERGLDTASFDAVISLWTHTDIDDYGGAIREGTRVLRSGGRLLYLGAHPCFVGPHSRFFGTDGIPKLHDGYLTPGRYGTDAPGVNPEGVRAKIGAAHLPLGEFLHAFIDAGLTLEHIEELARDRYPAAVALRWIK